MLGPARHFLYEKKQFCNVVVLEGFTPPVNNYSFLRKHEIYLKKGEGKVLSSRIFLHKPGFLSILSHSFTSVHKNNFNFVLHIFRF